MATPNQGTGYTNLQDYLKANQGNRLGSTLTSGIQNTTDQANNQLNQQVGDFDQGINAENSRIGSAFNQSSASVNTLDQNPTGFTPDDLSQVQGFQKTTYNGPNGLKDENALNIQSNNIANLGQLAGSNAGRGQLLRTFVNDPNYTQAGQDLDSLFLGNDIDDKLRGSKQAANKYTDQTAQDEQAAKFRAGSAGTNLTNQQGTINNNITGIGNNLNTLLGSRLTAAQKQDTAFQNAISNDDLNALASAGYTVPQSAVHNLGTANYYGIGGNYFNQLASPTYSQNASLAGLANDNDRAKAAALAQLTNDQTYNTYTTGGKYTAPSLGISETAAKGTLDNQYNTLQGETLDQLANQYGGQYNNFKGLLNAVKAQDPNGAYGTIASNQTLAQILGNQTDFSKSINGGSSLAGGISNLRNFLTDQFGQASDTQNTQSGGNSNPSGPTQPADPNAKAPTVLPPNFDPSHEGYIWPDPNTGSLWSWSGATQSWTKVK